MFKSWPGMRVNIAGHLPHARGSTGKSGLALAVGSLVGALLIDPPKTGAHPGSSWVDCDDKVWCGKRTRSTTGAPEGKGKMQM